MKNREIKFRGFGSEWRYGSYVKDYFKDRDAIIYYNPDGKKTVSFVKRESVGQYTGLKDKNGKEIYEGDFIEVDRYQKKWVYEIIWNSGETNDFNSGEYAYLITGFCAKLIKVEDSGYLFRIGEIVGIGKTYEFTNCGTNGDIETNEYSKIIGNIFEPPPRTTK